MLTKDKELLKLVIMVQNLVNMLKSIELSTQRVASTVCELNLSINIFFKRKCVTRDVRELCRDFSYGY